MGITHRDQGGDGDMQEMVGLEESPDQAAKVSANAQVAISQPKTG